MCIDEWNLPDSGVTPEAYYLRRREFLRVFGLGLAASALLPPGIRAEPSGLNDSLNPSYKLDGVKLTPEDLITSYNNFYEWGLAKDQPKDLANRGWKTRPWQVEIGGSCANPRKLDVDELIQLLGPIERRNYRHRCVEAWSMVIPWDGFPLAKLVDLAQPKPEAKYIRIHLIFRSGELSGPAVKRFCVAIHRRPHNSGSPQRIGIHRRRALRQPAAQSERRAASTRRPLEVRI